MNRTQEEKRRNPGGLAEKSRDERGMNDSGPMPADLFADLEATLDQVAEANPRIQTEDQGGAAHTTDLRALLEVSMAINSTLVLDDVLQNVMHKAIEFMQAERGLIMLLDEDGQLQTRAAYNLSKDEMQSDDYRISSSVASEVVATGRSIYTSDAMADERYASQKSVVELHLRSIMCVALTVKSEVIGVIYLDNSSQTKMFLKADLYLFELYAQMVSNALHNARIYDSLLHLKRYSDSVVKSSPVGIVVIDSSGHIATINPAALEIFDLNRKDLALIGDTQSPTVFLDLLPANQKSRWHRMINTVFATGEEFADARFFHDTGYIEKVLSIKMSPIPQVPGGGDGLVMAIEDVTEKVTMERYVILSEKLVARGEMAASVAHELNNYLSIISNNAELLGMNLTNERYEKAKFNSKSIVENVFKIKRFVDSLMDFSKPEPEYISYDVRHLIDDLLFSLRIQPRFKTVHFTLDLADDLPNVEIDVGQIQQVLMNLLNNAVDAIDQRTNEESDKDFKREIGIEAKYRRSHETVSVKVTDNGVGMSEETVSKIFTLHFTTKKGGHGLGLYNCKKIVEGHGGELVASSTPGKGTMFQLILPRFQSRPE
ncbi:MAG: ATP-binding protein [candidate division Zixibacteria bacterium]|jgi:PAS domain S-box-containing protein|nr:ATP-binding protein [candidate division Zixibacteria bacterium]